ncbi:SigE family RNA polymerase sigma factor [Nocardioides anomalus]|uniref:SigE family RNA polymerase sigma factor n=1 Tax=Nocardioides anomalus TaxID=2712223 RepID=A0A6G6WE01_9ACTN|nr:SigE family RNA polymerase sigma factor [Nocardioides anomalus]QIG43270.1 SigE family RNA polymerase sigma factor [Nocardioides anomalus]
MARSPSDEDFTQFVHAAWPGLYRTAYLLVGDAALAEDLVQTALAKTYAAWSSVRDVQAAPGFARTTMVNTAASWFRRRSWRNELPTSVLPEGRVESDHALRPTVLDALAQLPPRQRAVVVLRYYDDHSVAETARALSVTEGTVKSQTAKALDTLRRLLGDAIVPMTSGVAGD